jgi:hypothetical protein
MFANVARTGTIDRIGIAVSGLCLVHCLASAIFVAMLARPAACSSIHRSRSGLVFAIALGILRSAAA